MIHFYATNSGTHGECCLGAYLAGSGLDFEILPGSIYAEKISALRERA